MQNFMIRQLRVSGPGKQDGVVPFKDGLNIIQGRSNTGKTWILKCIHYLFSSDTRPFSPNTGYTDIEGIFETKKYGIIRITRKLDEMFAYVEADSDAVENGAYGTNYQQEGTLFLNDLWIRIIGLDETIFVPKSSRYARERISWTNISNVFWVDEDEIAKSDSIIIKDSYSETALLSSLFFLLTGDYKKGVSEILKPEIATAKKGAVVDYIEEQVKYFSGKRADYIRQLEELDATDITAQMQELSVKIQVSQEEIKELIEENASIIRQMSEYQQKEANCRVLVDRYESLISQYKADLQRMDFIAKGEQAVKDLPVNDVCPFCGGTVVHEDETYIEAIQAEIKRIASELAIIAATESDVQSELEEIEKVILGLRNRRESIGQAIETKNVEVHDYQENLAKFKDYTMLQSGIDFVNEQLEELGKKKVSELQKKKNPPLYHPKKEFEEYVGIEFNEILNRILKDCNYRVGYATWDFKIFDILMDGVPKSEDQGKGYRAFLNSIVALMLYEYFNQEQAYIKPGILMIDTPLLGFDEEEEGFDGKTLKKGLYNYFLSHQGDGQVIIVDNLNVMPDIDLSKYDVNVITYHKNEKNGNVYGFMPSWRKDIPKETL